jgi:hypothetical protein
MVKAAHDRVTRFAADLVDAAAAEGARQSRSAKQQLDHWARVGRAVTSTESASWRRVEAAFAGRLPLRDLTPEEGVVFTAEVAARVEESLSAGNLRAELNRDGLATVSFEDGQLVEYRPDGSRRILSDQT